jgi:hypothetical protein
MNFGWCNSFGPDTLQTYFDGQGDRVDLVLCSNERIIAIHLNSILIVYSPVIPQAPSLCFLLYFWPLLLVRVIYPLVGANRRRLDVANKYVGQSLTSPEVFLCILNYPPSILNCHLLLQAILPLAKICANLVKYKIRNRPAAAADTIPPRHFKYIS